MSDPLEQLNSITSRETLISAIHAAPEGSPMVLLIGDPVNPYLQQMFAIQNSIEKMVWMARRIVRHFEGM